MKCGKHLGDLSGGGGVCASCLRERLFVVIAAQAQAELDDRCLSSEEDGDDAGRLRVARHSMPPVHRQVTMQCLVSPGVVQRRKSSSYFDRPRHRRRFFSTPQVGPTFSNNPVFEPSDCYVPEKKSSRLSLFGLFFRNRSDKVAQPNPAPSAQPLQSSSIFGFWKNKKKKQSQASSTTTTDSVASGSVIRRKCAATMAVSNRGMSPAEASEDDNGDRSPSGAGYTSDDCPYSWKRSPAPSTSTTTTTVRRRNAGTATTPQHPSNIPGLVLCLSPMVRAIPSGNRRNKACMAVEARLPGEIRAVPAKGRRHSVDIGLSKNRSRKLADIGRGAHNR